MNKYIVLLSTLIVGASCSHSCYNTAKDANGTGINLSSSSSSSSSSSGTFDVDQIIKTDNYQLTLPSSFFHKTSQDLNSISAWIDSSKEITIMIVNEQFEGNQDQYLIDLIQGLKRGNNDIKSEKLVKINNVEYSLVEFTSVNNKVSLQHFVWATVFNGRGIGFACGGKEGFDVRICNTAINNFIIH